MKNIFHIGIRIFFLLQVVLLIAQLSSCKRDLPPTLTTGYPSQINTIITTQCAIIGCHNTQSKEAAGGLDMTSWTTLFQGSNGGSDVIPYRSDRSWLCSYTNIYPDLGLSLVPIMPINGTPISHTEESLIQNWINSGAPDVNGNVAFCCNANRDKYYVADQACNEAVVFDTKTKLAMRYIPVGNPLHNVSSPHCVRVSPDQKYWYVVFYGGNIVQKFDAATDQLIANINVGYGAPGNSGLWSNLIISADGHYGLVSDWEATGEVVLVDLENLSVLKTFGPLSFPHGIAATPDFSEFYCTGAVNSVQWFQLNPSTFEIENDAAVNLYTSAEGISFEITPHDVIFTPDYKYLLVSGQSSNDVRVVDVSDNSLYKIINVGTYPQEFAISKKYPYIFLSCEDDNPNPTLQTEGSVYVFNYSDSLNVVKVINQQMLEPHGISVDDNNNLLIVCSLNTTGNPHHSTDCGGKDGFVGLVDLSTLNFIAPYKTEVSAFPYFAAVRSTQ